jgi:hypothetical protein
MRVLLMSLVMMVSASAFATSLEINDRLMNGDESVTSQFYEGVAAEAKIQQIMNIGTSVESFSSELGRGINGDIVSEEIVQISGVVGKEKLECESHEFTIVQSSGEHNAEYTNTAICYVK